MNTLRKVCAPAYNRTAVSPAPNTMTIRLDVRAVVRFTEGVGIKVIQVIGKDIRFPPVLKSDHFLGFAVANGDSFIPI